MPDNPIAGLYPTYNPAQNSFASDPMRTISALMMMQANQREQQRFNAQRALGGAALNNLDPQTGILNIPQFSAAGRTDPNMALAGGEAANLAMNQAQAQNALRQQQTSALYNVVGSLGAKPDLSLSDVNDALTDYAAKNPTIPSAAIEGIRRQFYASKNLKNTAVTFGNMARGAEAINPAVQANPNTGQPQYTTTGGQSYAGTSGAGENAAGPLPGVPEAVANNQAQYVKDQDQATQLAANLRSVKTIMPLLPLMAGGNFGPQSQNYRTVRAGLIQAGVIPPDATDTAMFEEVDKLLHQYQGTVRGAGRSDMALGQALAGTPNANLSKPGLRRTLLNQMGMDTMDSAMPQAFALENPGAAQTKAGYVNYRAQFQKQNDPRGFVWNQMTPQEQQEALKSVGYTADPKTGQLMRPAPGSAHYADYLKLAHAKALADQLGQ